MSDRGVIYVGKRDGAGNPQVLKKVDDLASLALPPRFDLARHADGLNWAYSGSGPRQLAVALLADVLGDEFALELSQRFKQDVVARLPHEGFSISAEAVEEWARGQEKQEEG